MNDKKPVRVLYLCSYIDGTIVDKYGLSLFSPAGLKKKQGVINSLESLDVKVTVLSPILVNDFKFKFFKSWKYRGDRGADIHFPSTITLFPFNILLLFFSSILHVMHIKKMNGFDVIIFYNYRFNVVFPAIFSKLVYQTPIILQYEDGLFDAPSRFTAILSTVLEWFVKRFLDGAVLVSSTFEKRIKTDNFAVLRGFIEDIKLTEETGQPIKNKKIVLFFGQFDTVRGIDIFLEACRMALDDETIKDKLEFWIAGYGNEGMVQKVEEAASKLINTKYIGFLHPNSEDYKNILGSVDITVNLQKPSIKFSTYCFPSKILEFMSYEKIIISTDISDIKRISNGRIVLTGPSPSDFILVLKDIIENYENYAEYGVEAKKWVIENCTMPPTGVKLRRVIDRALNSKTLK